MTTPSITKTTIQGLIVNSCYISPFLNRSFFTFMLNVLSVCSISNLIGLCRPSAIRRFIVTIIVNSINAVQSAWAQPHIRDKVFKLKPSFAYFNTPAKMRRISRVVKSAPSNHSTPYFIFIALTHAMSMLKLFVSTSCNFFSQAPTRKANTIAYICRLKNPFSSTVASAQMLSLSIFSRFSFRDNSKPPIFFTNHINYFAHVLHTILQSNKCKENLI